MAYRVLGITDDFCQCHCCGRDDLKSTVAMETLDADGNGTGDVSYFGSVCAAKMLGIEKKTPARLARKLTEMAADGYEAARQEIFQKHCWLCQSAAGNYYLLNETRLSQLPGTMAERIAAAVKIRNEKFPILSK